MSKPKTTIRLIKPYISFAELEHDLRDILASGILTRGRKVADFAEGLASYTGSPHAYPTTSATTALSLCLKVLGIGRGDEVVVADFSFPASANVVETAGARPVFCDVDPMTWNMDPDCLEKRIGPKTKGVIFVDAMGNPSGVHAISSICEKHEIPLIEDAACALGSSESGRRCGSIATLSCFSFHPRKLLTTGEGGCVTTADPAMAESLALLLNHGGTMVEDHLEFVAPGFNYRMSEIQAAMGLAQLSRLDDIIQRRQQFRNACTHELRSLGFRPQETGTDVHHNVQSLVYTVPEGMDRDRLIHHLAHQGVESSLGTYCLSNTKFYREKYDDVQPIAMRLQETTLTLPCHDEVDPDQLISAVASFSG
ncbi:MULTISPECIES: DegT/DnrJ/EryC1/StrS family aminotransferase [unclassified Pseudodesulfovibrio]|uniref:DegT/DnrJ/EryC1/StrS family aminotransferase n=1 Tax=unclassified Pseudodesulfovibrio TaxID=2661612 RepID=UPI000FEB73C2|nr:MULTISPECIES: DegT/DnrJ/EryC1/StrS family aminotransferase [unclassified Pseudodesulfovibrio]MCJ2165645.1 DegT/DnrJ/EryC1/StrS family aminotransferase [Pseudodesulfovibrio sp. S3-i]RWU03059.1 DegT/DnrJ/EryC1/StrS family aminotransferase [Pseudodesulfovibrio sp. S3]